MCVSEILSFLKVLPTYSSLRRSKVSSSATFLMEGLR